MTMSYDRMEIRLICPEDKLLSRIATRVAKITKEAMRAGHSVGGEDLPWQNKTGALVGSVKSKKTKQRKNQKPLYIVAPSWSRVASLSKTARSYYGLMRIHMFGVYRRSEAYRALAGKRQLRRLLWGSRGARSNPLAVGTDALDTLIGKYADDVIRRAWNRELRLAKKRAVVK